MGKTIALETRYDVTTHVPSSLVAARFPAMCGMETLTTVVSSTSMKVASITDTVTTQGFTACCGRVSTRTAPVTDPLPEHLTVEEMSVNRRDRHHMRL